MNHSGRDMRFTVRLCISLLFTSAKNVASTNAFFSSTHLTAVDLPRIHINNVTTEWIRSVDHPHWIDGISQNWKIFDMTRDELVDYVDELAPFHLHDTYNASLKTLLSSSGYKMGHVVLGLHGCYSDPWRPYSPGLASDEFMSLIGLPRVLRQASTWQMGVGNSGGLGVPPEHHPSSWFVPLIGRKVWVVHPPNDTAPVAHLRRRSFPVEKRCMDTSTDPDDDAIVFVQHPGQVLWLPDFWWHETCGLDEFSMGVGAVIADASHMANQMRFNEVMPTEPCVEHNAIGHGYRIQDIPSCRASKTCRSLEDIALYRDALDDEIPTRIETGATGEQRSLL